MTTMRVCPFALLLGLLACTTVSAQPAPPADPAVYAADYPSPDDDLPDPGEYEQSLSPYGRWYDAPTYGRVWMPSVAFNWQPYTQGYWAWSPYGWTWVSYEPWGWTFHYGRWTYLRTGWAWVPGRVWGPAWVDWYWGDGVVGWAPLGPFGHHATVINHFVFVNDRDFCSRRVHHHVRDWRHVPRGVARDWGRRRDFRPPPHDRIRRVAREPVHRFNGRPPGTVGPPALDRRPADRGPRFIDQPRERRADAPRRDRPNDDRRAWRRPGDTRRFDDDQPGGRRSREDVDERPVQRPRAQEPRRFGSTLAPGWQRGGRAVREPDGFVTPRVPRAARQPVAPAAPRVLRAPNGPGAAPVGGTAPTMVAPRGGGSGGGARMLGRAGGNGGNRGAGNGGGRAEAGAGRGQGGGRGGNAGTGMPIGR